MAIPDRPDAANLSSGPKWWIKPALISVLNVAVSLIVVTFLVGWSTLVLAVVIAGFALGSWWFVDQRPGRHRSPGAAISTFLEVRLSAACS